MKVIHAVLATSHVDLHNERLALSALESMVRAIDEAYLPILVQHDPRLPPVGRIASASLTRLDDGAYAVEGLLELFDPEECVAPPSDSREMRIRTSHSASLEITYDRSYLDAEDQMLLANLSKLLSTEAHQELKKSLDPVSVLTLTGAFILGSVAKGFLSKIGGEAYDSFKRKVNQLLERRRAAATECVLLFRATVTRPRDGAVLEVDVFATDPTPGDTEGLFSTALEQLDRLLPSYFQPEANIRRLVFELAAGNLEFRFGVNNKCVPMKARLAAGAD